MLKWTTLQIAHREIAGAEATAESDLQLLLERLQTNFANSMSGVLRVKTGNISPQDAIEATESMGSQQQEQIKEIVHMVHALKAQFELIQTQISQATESQRTLERQVRSLQRGRAVLLHGAQSSQCHSSASQRTDVGSQSAASSACCPFCSRPLPDGGSPVPLPRLPRDSRGSGERYLSPLLKSFIASLPGPGEIHADGHSDSDSHFTPPVIMRKKKSGGTMPRSLTQVDRRRSSSGESDGLSLKSSQSGGSKGQGKVSSSSNRSPSANDGLSRRAHRYCIVKELTESERNYCATLRTILKHYYEPLRAQGHVSEADCQTIFPPCLQRIYDYHCGVLRALEDRMAHWKSRDVVGDIFAHFTEAHERPGNGAGYREYIENFSTAVAAIGRLEKSSEQFRRSIKGCELNSPAKHGLVSLLMFPVRRIPNYVLMLQQILKYTKPNHPDEFYIPSCLSKFGDILRAMDSSIDQTLQNRSDTVTSTADNGSSLLNSRSRTSCMSSDGGEELEDEEEDHKASSTTTKDSGNYSNCDDMADAGDHVGTQPSQATTISGMFTLPRSFLKKASTLSFGNGTLGKIKTRESVMEKSRWDAEVGVCGHQALTTLPRAPAKKPLTRSKSQTEMLHQSPTKDSCNQLSPSPRARRSVHEVLIRMQLSQQQHEGQRDKRMSLVVDTDKPSAAMMSAGCTMDQQHRSSAESLQSKLNQGKMNSSFKSSSKDRPTSYSQPDLLGHDDEGLPSCNAVTLPNDEAQPKRKTIGKSIKSFFSKKRVSMPSENSRRECSAPVAGSTSAASSPPRASSSPLPGYLNTRYEPPKMFSGDASIEDITYDLVDMHDCVDATMHLDLNTYEDENGEPYSAV